MVYIKGKGWVYENSAARPMKYETYKELSKQLAVGDLICKQCGYIAARHMLPWDTDNHLQCGVDRLGLFIYDLPIR